MQIVDMAGQAEPPPLFENINIKTNEDEDDDLFASAVQVQLTVWLIIFCVIRVILQDVGPLSQKGPLHEDEQQQPPPQSPHELKNGDVDVSKLKITEQKTEMENVPINNDTSAPTPTMEEVILYFFLIILLQMFDSTGGITIWRPIYRNNNNRTTKNW